MEFIETDKNKIIELIFNDLSMSNQIIYYISESCDSMSLIKRSKKGK